MPRSTSIGGSSKEESLLCSHAETLVGVFWTTPVVDWNDASCPFLFRIVMLAITVLPGEGSEIY